jgi:hypothetical protein
MKRLISFAILAATAALPAAAQTKATQINWNTQIYNRPTIPSTAAQVNAVADPGANGIVFRTGLGAARIATLADLTALGVPSNPMTTPGDLVVGGLSGAFKRVAAPANGTYCLHWAGGIVTLIGCPTGNGSLSSVGLTMPSGFTVTGSPLTANGSLSVTLATQTASAVLIAPTAGGVPTWRAPLAADIPPLPYQAILGGTYGDGSHDDTAAIVAGLAAMTNGKVMLQPGTYLVSANITIGAGKELDCQGATIAYSGAHGITMTGAKARFTNCNIAPSTAADKWVWTGVALSGCDQCELTRVGIYQPTVGLHVVNSVNNRGSIDIWNYKTKGVFFDSSGGSAAGNNFSANEITGSSVSGSIGIHNQDSANTIIGPELSLADTGIQNEGKYLTVAGAFVEQNLSSNITALTGSSMSFSGSMDATPNTLQAGAFVDTFGKGALGLDTTPNSQITFKGMTAYYAFNEGSGATLYDWSGNGRTATVTGSTSWASGPYGSAMLIPYGAGYYITVPTTAITVGSPYTVAMLLKADTTANLDNVPFFQVTATTGTQAYNMVGLSSVFGYQQYPNNSVAFNLAQATLTPGKWFWQFWTYEPTGGTLTGINPAANSTVCTHAAANPFTGSITGVKFLNTSAATNLWIGQLAIWQGTLTPEAARAWMTSNQAPVPPPGATFSINNGTNIVYRCPNSPYQVYWGSSAPGGCGTPVDTGLRVN